MKKYLKKILYILTISSLTIPMFTKYLGFILNKIGFIYDTNFVNYGRIFCYIFIPLIFIYLYDLLKIRKKIDLLDFLFFLFLIISILCIIFSKDYNIALYGCWGRFHGFFAILCFNLLLNNWKNYGEKIDYKILIKIIIGIGIFNAIYSLMQMYTNFSFVERGGHISAFGLCGNPNFFGSLIVTELGIVTTCYLLNKKRNYSILLIILFFISLYNSQSTGPFFTYIIYLIIIFIYLLKVKMLNLKKYIILIITVIITYILVYNINVLNARHYNEKMFNEYSSKSLKSTANTGGNYRLEIWKNTFSVIKKNWLIGVGYENLYLNYPGNKLNRGYVLIPTTNGLVDEELKREDYITDNAHNVYLHTFVETGIFGIISYLLLCFATFIRAIKSKKKEVIILLGGFVTYSIQAFSNISVITVAPIYYVIIGLILAFTKNNKQKNKS